MRHEQKIEEYLTEQVQARGALCEKFVSPGRRGVPDRLITWRPVNPMRSGQMDLVETKAENGRLRPEQRRDHKRRAMLGIRVYLLNSRAKVDTYVNARARGMHVPELYSRPDQ